MDICICVDQNYSVLAASCISFLIKHNTPKNIFILTLPADQSIFQKLAHELFDGLQVTVLAPNEDQLKALLEINNTKGISGYLRLLIPDIFASFTKILYLDVDLIILEGLTSLWRENIENYLFAAAIDTGAKKHPLEGFPTYFNSGVMLCNLEEMRKQKFTKNTIEYLKSNRKTLRFNFGDQDALNVLYSNQCKILHTRWNVLHKDWIAFTNNNSDTTVTNDLTEAMERPAIMHMAGYGETLKWGLLDSVYAKAWYDEVASLCNKSSTLLNSYSEIIKQKLANSWPKHPFLCKLIFQAHEQLYQSQK